MKKGYIIAILAIAGVIGLSKAIYSSQNINTARAGGSGGRSMGTRSTGRSFGSGSTGRSVSGANVHRTTHVSRTAGTTDTTRTGTGANTGQARMAGTRTRTAGTRTTAGRTGGAQARNNGRGGGRDNNARRGNWGHGRSHNWHNRSAFMNDSWGAWWLGLGAVGAGAWWWSNAYSYPYVQILPSCAVAYIGPDGTVYQDTYVCNAYANPIYYRLYNGYYYVSDAPTFSFGISSGF